MKRGLVLGGGGLVGLSYHAGVFKALHESGIAPARAEIIVGTSAGSIIAAYLAAGWKTDDFYEFAHGRHRDAIADAEGQRHEMQSLFQPLWQARHERLRRSVGGLFAVAAARGLWPGGLPPTALRRAFPSGMYSSAVSRERLHRDLPQEWPREGVYLSTVDLYSGRRVVFGAPGAPPAPYPDAVLASTAIPGFFPPVKIGDRYYVDGGVASATSLDLAAGAGCGAILCVAPLGYLREAGSPFDLRVLAPMAVRSLFARTLRREVVAARAQGAEVLVLRPWLSDLASHGTNSMRRIDRAALSEEARVGTLRALERNADHPVLRAFEERPTESRARSEETTA